MYAGEVLALTVSAIFFKSILLVGYTGLFILATDLLVVFYEEPVLKQTFEKAYEDYCAWVRRWMPAMKRQNKNSS